MTGRALIGSGSLRGAIALVAALLPACAVNPRPTFDSVSSAVKSRNGMETTWMRTAAEEEAVLARVREILKEPLSPRRAAQIALMNNRALQARLEELGIAQANLVAAGLPGNPEVEAFFGWPSEPSAPRKIDLGFGLDVLDLLVLPSRKRLAALELKQAKAIAGDEVLTLAAKAQVEAYDLQALESRAALTATSVEIEEAVTEFAEARAKAGTLSNLDLETERAVLDDLRARRAELNLEIRKGREAINQTLGLWGDLTTWTMAPLAADLPQVDPDGTDFERIALEQRFDLAASRAAIDLLEGTLKLQKKTRLLPAGVRVGVHSEKEEVRITGPSLQLQLPIFNPGRAESARVEAMYLQAQRLFEDRAVRARAEVREKRDQLLGARELIRHHEGIAGPRKKRIVEMMRGYYNMMLKGADDILRARRDEVEGEAALIDARRSYWVARTELTLALGGSLPGRSEGDNR